MLDCLELELQVTVNHLIRLLQKKALLLCKNKEQQALLPAEPSLLPPPHYKFSIFSCSTNSRYGGKARDANSTSRTCRCLCMGISVALADFGQEFTHLTQGKGIM